MSGRAFFLGDSSGFVPAAIQGKGSFSQHVLVFHSLFLVLLIFSRLQFRLKARKILGLNRKLEFGMASREARRGRPKGSGLDDRLQLRRIVELLERDPALKPTTAIKAIGITDPSVIRRLREKLKTETIVRPARAPVAPAAAPSVPLHSVASADPERPSAAPCARPAPAPSSTGAGLAAVPGEPAKREAWFTTWCALGLSAVSSTLQAQAALMNGLLDSPHVQCALRHQLLFNEVAKALCPKRSDIRTVH